MQPSNITSPDSDFLSAFAKEMLVAHRNFRSYPKGHPLVEQGLEKAVQAYGELMQQTEQLSVAIAKDSVLVDGVPRNRPQASLRQFAHLFFRQGVGFVTLNRGLTVEELRRIIMLLGITRDAVNRHGGIESVWEKARVSSIVIRAIRYDVFTSGMDSAEGNNLWERVARGMLHDSFTPEGVASLELDPEILAELFNGAEGNALDGEKILNFLVQEESLLPNDKMIMVYERLADFVTTLNPALRDQFLSSAIGALRPDGSSPVENIIRSMPSETVLSILDGINRDERRLPPVLVTLLQRLGRPEGAASAGHPDLPPDLTENMRAIFSEHATEQYIPAEYQQKLDAMVSLPAAPTVPNQSGPSLNTLEDTAVEERFGEIILLLAGQGGEREDLETLATTIEEMCDCLLHTGDYGQVLNLLRKSADTTFPEEFRQMIRASVSRSEFTEEILNGLVIWGKSRYGVISELIDSVGEPFVTPLLDRLAVEETISIRRFLIEKLSHLGPLAASEIVNRLSDSRWYFLRNLLIILRSLDSSLAPHVRPLLKHRHEAVRQESLATLQHFRDPFVDRRILLDLQGDDRKAQLSALQVAGRSHSPEVFGAVLSVAITGGLSTAEVEMRCAAVKTLGQMASVSALPYLERILDSSSLIRRKALSDLKMEIIRSLANYPAACALPILNRITRENRNEAESAEARKILKEKRQ